MKKTEKLSRWLLILIVFEVLLLLYCLFFAREILIEEGLFFVLGLFSAIVLSDLLLTWTILLSFALGIVFLVAGVVYIPFHQALLLLFSFPILIGILTQIRYHLFKEIAKVKDQEPEAYADYRNRIASYGGETNDTDSSLTHSLVARGIVLPIATERVQSDLEPNQLFGNASSKAK